MFDSKGEKLYVGIGSGSNIDTGEDPMRAAINRFNPDGSGHEIYASGTRNPIGLHWYPGTNTLWAGVQSVLRWAMTWCPTFSLTSSSAPSTVGLTLTLALTRNHAIKASGPTWWRRPFPATFCCSPM